MLLLREDYDFFSKNSKAVNVIDTVPPEQLAELTELVNEPFGHETEGHEDFKMATARWRMK